MRVLVVEDQPKIAKVIHEGLTEDGFEVELCDTGEEGFALAMSKPFDAMVLDLMLPGHDGLTVLKSLRDQSVTVPVIILTAKNELNERVKGLELGADDYMTKPFYVEELAARLKAQVRRASGVSLNLLQVGDITMNLLSREVRRSGKAIDLRDKEFALLEFFMRSPGRVHPRSQISAQVWKINFDTGTNLVDVTVGRLRNKIDADFDLKLIETVRGVGYRFREREAGSEPS